VDSGTFRIVPAKKGKVTHEAKLDNFVKKRDNDLSEAQIIKLRLILTEVRIKQDNL